MASYCLLINSLKSCWSFQKDLEARARGPRASPTPVTREKELIEHLKSWYSLCPMPRTICDNRMSGVCALFCLLPRCALRPTHAAVTSAVSTLLCGPLSARCWATWLYSYDRGRRTRWANSSRCMSSVGLVMTCVVTCHMSRALGPPVLPWLLPT